MLRVTSTLKQSQIHSLLPHWAVLTSTYSIYDIKVIAMIHYFQLLNTRKVLKIHAVHLDIETNLSMFQLKHILLVLTHCLWVLHWRQRAQLFFFSIVLLFLKHAIYWRDYIQNTSTIEITSWFKVEPIFCLRIKELTISCQTITIIDSERGTEDNIPRLVKVCETSFRSTTAKLHN